MSKERELLKRVRDTLRELKETHYDLYWDIQAKLDLDEQVPVAWIYEWAVKSSFDGSFTGEWKEELSKTKPDGTVKGFSPTKLESTVRNLVPLYTIPPKCEPAQTAREMYQRGYAKAKDDLKREPLSDDWIKDNIHLIHQDVSFTDLVRSIEKAHGIGVNDD
jgi:hypothetical protein